MCVLWWRSIGIVLRRNDTYTPIDVSLAIGSKNLDEDNSISFQFNLKDEDNPVGDFFGMNARGLIVTESKE